MNKFPKYSLIFMSESNILTTLTSYNVQGKIVQPILLSNSLLTVAGIFAITELESSSPTSQMSAAKPHPGHLKSP
jgi:hypothetical protein